MLCVWEGIVQPLPLLLGGTGAMAVAVSIRGFACPWLCPFGMCTWELTGVWAPAPAAAAAAAVALRCLRRRMKRSRKTIAAMRAAPPTATGTAMATFVVVLKPPLWLVLDLVLVSLLAAVVGVADATLLGLIPTLDSAGGMEEGTACAAVLLPQFLGSWSRYGLLFPV